MTEKQIFLIIACTTGLLALWIIRRRWAHISVWIDKRGKIRTDIHATPEAVKPSAEANLNRAQWGGSNTLDVGHGGKLDAQDSALGDRNRINIAGTNNTQTRKPKPR